MCDNWHIQGISKPCVQNNWHIWVNKLLEQIMVYSNQHHLLFVHSNCNNYGEMQGQVYHNNFKDIVIIEHLVQTLIIQSVG